MGDWQNGTCGCFSDIGTCCLTYFCPCVTAGQNAEAVGESCCCYGFLATCACIGFFTRASIRGKIREKYGIPVSEVIFCASSHFNLSCGTSYSLVTNVVFTD